MKIEEIIEAIHENLFRITNNAEQEAEFDDLSFAEIYSSVFHGEIIEIYPTDQPYPSCLVYLQTGTRFTVFGLITKK